MSLKIVESEKRTFAPIPAGTYPARCVGLVDLGVQYNERYNKEQHKVRIVWELPTETIERDGKQEPRWISKPYTASLHEKAELRKDLESWRGKSYSAEELHSFDLSSILDEPCMLSITHKTSQSGKLFALVSGVSQPMRGMAVPVLKNPPFLFDFDFPTDRLWSALEALPRWMREEVQKSKTWAERVAQGAVESGLAAKADDLFHESLPWTVDE